MTAPRRLAGHPIRLAAWWVWQGMSYPLGLPAMLWLTVNEKLEG
jgi:hypothetical protein